MGLDNGINIVRNDYSDKIKALKRFTVSYDKDEIYPFEVCYWRKCWNVRGEILDIVGVENECQYMFTLDIPMIEEIISVLESYNAKTWIYGSWADSIWEWSEHKRANRRHIKNLKHLVRVMKKYPDLEVYFYDSY
jgi:hypothetical protein